MENKDDRNKISVKGLDMTTDMEADAYEIALKALDRFSIEKDMAQYIKNEFDRLHEKYWHCIVGKQFGSSVTHDSKHYIYFYIGEMSFLLYRFG
ncbi:neuronal nitric oxidse synthase protein inhibitor, putative [Ichthyophthirius multifiliis]|uniref:Dynein light chain n=1 Tax=Ichthyophthirius multifiliis TaxID=5932 RepID=G0R0Z3_ICHMU|nr:neuronal nitric oxidse synthase protein inhibitor, putative [Ichthyophthirius multifiliis]EGR28858.1 neuronal nitric oxidse synthase protein inhibitor, putative [Ichthyophthirius multifiliis]|eukprot:XP_004030094.1 neuronal nitric oxidse synthase protein inhibitor, putative [Ichthyophthirius multifiliis]